jgi:putative Holliday junction resolvase
MSAPARMIGVDVGERRIGVAVSEGAVAVPLRVIEHTSRASDVARVAAIAQEHDARAVVVGLPLSMSGEERDQARRTRVFGEALAQALAVPVVYQDERLTSVQAGRAQAAATAKPRRVRNAAGVHPARRRAKPRVDDVAAAIILQAYIDAHGAQG